MNLSDAQVIAEKYRKILAPYCDRIEIAGSVRREKAYPGDIEIVAIPRLHDYCFYAEEINKLHRFKGNASSLYTQRWLPEGIKLDLFRATKENWGLIFAIRTGSAKYSEHVLAAGWVRAGYHSADGMLQRRKGMTVEKIPVPEEKDLFELIGVRYVEPKEREI